MQYAQNLNCHSRFFIVIPAKAGIQSSPNLLNHPYLPYRSRPKTILTVSQKILKNVRLGRQINLITVSEIQPLFNGKRKNNFPQGHFKAIATAGLRSTSQSSLLHCFPKSPVVFRILPVGFALVARLSPATAVFQATAKLPLFPLLPLLSKAASFFSNRIQQ